MKRINVRRVLGLVACFAMLIGTLIHPVTTANAEETKGGGLHFANGYDWRESGDGYAHNIFAFASTDATATTSTFTGQAAGFLNWWYGFVLEYNAEKDTYVVTVPTTPPLILPKCFYPSKTAAKSCRRLRRKFQNIFKTNITPTRGTDATL